MMGESKPMKLSGCEKAIISREKLQDYLLSPFHPVGQFKAKFFRSIGYTSDSWERLREDIITLLNDADAILKE